MDTSTQSWTNPSVLQWARERFGLSYEEVEKQSKRLGNSYTPIESSHLMQWESGSAQPELEHLESLAEIYVCPVGYFFLKEPPKETLPLSFRGLSPEKQNKLKPLCSRPFIGFWILPIGRACLSKRKNLSGKQPFVISRNLKVTLVRLKASVQQERNRLGFTPDVRKNWASANEAFIWWRRRIEEQGIFCFQMKLETEDVRGASIWFESRYPFILVNHEDIESAAAAFSRSYMNTHISFWAGMDSCVTSEAFIRLQGLRPLRIDSRRACCYHMTIFGKD